MRGARHLSQARQTKPRVRSPDVRRAAPLLALNQLVALEPPSHFGTMCVSVGGSRQAEVTSVIGAPDAGLVISKGWLNAYAPGAFQLDGDPSVATEAEPGEPAGARAARRAEAGEHEAPRGISLGSASLTALTRPYGRLRHREWRRWLRFEEEAVERVAGIHRPLERNGLRPDFQPGRWTV